ncbi:MAG TPA: DedA family protein, partial [Euzebyales bacterium]|nr:DedA family protein [Euzebyales bacterium]
LPGEVAVLLGGVLASRGQVSLPLILLVAAVAAIAGDSAGYEIGRRWGRRLVGTRFLRRRADAVRDVERYVRRHGGVVMFLGRWTSVLRAFVPSVAGMGRMPYGRFLVFNIVGGVAWAAVFTLAGYAAGESYAVVDALTGRAAWILAGVLVAWVAVNLVRRRRVRSRWFAVDVGVWSDATSHGLCPSGATWTRTAALLWSGRGRTTWHHEAAPPATTAETRDEAQVVVGDLPDVAPGGTPAGASGLVHAGPGDDVVPAVGRDVAVVGCRRRGAVGGTRIASL